MAKPVFTQSITSNEFAQIIVDYIYNEAWDETDKEYVRKNDNSNLYHFTIGLSIRNEFVYPYLEQFDFLDGDVHPDSISDMIMRLLIERAKKDE